MSTSSSGPAFKSPARKSRVFSVFEDGFSRSSGSAIATRPNGQEHLNMVAGPAFIRFRALGLQCTGMAAFSCMHVPFLLLVHGLVSQVFSCWTYITVLLGVIGKSTLWVSILRVINAPMVKRTV